jgi:tight adherence protein B
MTWNLDPTLWAAVLLGAVSLGWMGYCLLLPFANRFETVAGRFQDRLPKNCFNLHRMATPFIVAALSVLLVLWLKDHIWTALSFIVLGLLLGGAVQRWPLWRKRRVEKERRLQCLEVFPQALEMTVQTLQVGQTLSQAIVYLSKEAPAPLREEFVALSLEMELGASPEDALAKFAQRFNHPDITRFLEAYRLSRRAGANLVHLYKIQLDGIEERHRLMRRLDSMTAQARLSGLLMGALPFFLLAVLFVMDADLLRPLVAYPAGWAVLLVAAGLETLGFLWIQKLMQVDL